jgi:hypothetical protein
VKGCVAGECAVGALMMERHRRFAQLWRSRNQDLVGLTKLQSVEEIVSWNARNRLLGFNTSAIRFRVLYALAKDFGATEFIETGSYHGATAVCARKSFGIPVSSCEASLINYCVARLIACCLHGVHIFHDRSEHWLPNQVQRVSQTENCLPLFYLDAHAGVDPASCPILAELSVIFRLDSFLIFIDDFVVPGKDFKGSTYGDVRLDLELIRPVLLAAGINKVYLPSYSPLLESGYARAGFVVLFRSAVLKKILENPRFPFDLLQAYVLEHPSLP